MLGEPQGELCGWSGMSEGGRRGDEGKEMMEEGGRSPSREYNRTSVFTLRDLGAVESSGQSRLDAHTRPLVALGRIDRGGQGGAGYRDLEGMAEPLLLAIAGG